MPTEAETWRVTKSQQAAPRHALTQTRILSQDIAANNLNLLNRRVTSWSGVRSYPLATRGERSAEIHRRANSAWMIHKIVGRASARHVRMKPGLHPVDSARVALTPDRPEGVPSRRAGFPWPAYRPRSDAGTHAGRTPAGSPGDDRRCRTGYPHTPPMRCRW